MRLSSPAASARTRRPCAASVCSGLEHLGIRLDEERNGAVSGSIAEIQADGGPVKLLVVKTDEEREIARQTVEVIRNAGLERPAGPVG